LKRCARREKRGDPGITNTIKRRKGGGTERWFTPGFLRGQKSNEAGLGGKKERKKVDCQGGGHAHFSGKTGYGKENQGGTDHNKDLWAKTPARLNKQQISKKGLGGKKMVLPTQSCALHYKFWKGRARSSKKAEDCYSGTNGLFFQRKILEIRETKGWGAKSGSGMSLIKPRRT